MNDKEDISSSLQGLTTGKSRLMSVIKFYDAMTGLVDKGKVVDIVYLAFSEAFGTVSHKVLIDKLLMYRLDEQMVR